MDYLITKLKDDYFEFSNETIIMFKIFENKQLNL